MLILGGVGCSTAALRARWRCWWLEEVLSSWTGYGSSDSDGLLFVVLRAPRASAAGLRVEPRMAEPCSKSPPLQHFGGVVATTTSTWR